LKRMKIIRSKETGFCYGVRRAIDILEKAAQQYGSLETLGPVVHNDQVTRRLDMLGIHVLNGIQNITGQVVAISSHGISPVAEAELRGRPVKLVDTTCPFVSRAQIAARRFAENGFFTLIYGEAGHPEVKGILGHARNKGLATLNISDIEKLEPMPKRLGILSQTTQIPENFNAFVKNVIDLGLRKDAEIRILDTICHDIRNRQSTSLDLASKVDLMLVIGGKSSANTRRLLELCSARTETHMIENAEEVDPLWLKGKNKIGITSGTSTPDFSIDEVIKRLEKLSVKTEKY
jgi:4-hydroxy-3-methylbut-2-en-1-yl diphosphate reductase